MILIKYTINILHQIYSCENLPLPSFSDVELSLYFLIYSVKVPDKGLLAYLVVGIG